MSNYILYKTTGVAYSLLWRHNGHDCVPNHQPHHCLLSCLFGRRSKKTSKLRITGLCVGNSPGTGEFPAQMASNAEKVSIWWRHHVYIYMSYSSSIHTGKRSPCWPSVGPSFTPCTPVAGMVRLTNVKITKTTDWHVCDSFQVESSAFFCSLLPVSTAGLSVSWW